MATTRVISTTVTFARPFILDGFEGLQRPGSYVVDTEQELIDSPSVTAWKRISTSYGCTGTVQPNTSRSAPIS